MPSEIATVVDMLGSAEFLTGLAVSTVLLVVLFASPRESRLWGIAVSVATITGFALVGGVPLDPIFGIVVLALGGTWLDRAERLGQGGQSVLAWGVLAAGGVLVSAALDGPAFVTFTAPIVILGAGHLLRRWGESSRFPIVGALFGITAAGIWLTVPDTEAPRVLLGASSVSALTTLRPFQARLTSSGSFALIGVVVWTVVIGGAARGGSIIAGWACLGALLLLPMLGFGRARLGNGAVIILHAVLVATASRIIGPWETALSATAAVLILGLVSSLAVRALAGSPG